MDILIGTPTFDRRVDIEFLKTIAWLERLGKYNLQYSFPVSSLLCRGRNLCCKLALETKCEWLLFLDSDLGIPDDKFLDKMLETSYKLEAQVIGGVYRMKNDNNAIIAGKEIKNNKSENYKVREIKEPQLVDWVGTGIMLIHYEVLEKVKDPWFEIIERPNLDTIPEDYYFCQKAKKKGFKIAIDPRFKTSHIGNSVWIM